MAGHPAQKRTLPELMAGVFAILLQIQVTLFATDNYAGLRVSLADLFLPVAGGLVLLSLLKRRSLWPTWKSRYTLPLLATLIAVMTIAIAQSGLQGSGNFKWALLNKYIGFLILIAYLKLGAWLAQNGQKTIETFTRVFISFFLFTLIMSTIAFFVSPLLLLPLWIDAYPWDGFMANRNAFALLAIFIVLLIVNTQKRPMQDKPKTEPILRRTTDPEVLIWLLLPIFSMYNDSRAGWLVCAAIIVTMALKAPKNFMKMTVPLLALGAVLAYGSLNVQEVRQVKDGHQLNRLIELGTHDQNKMYGGDRKRLIALEDGLELYRASNPLIGAGLGAYKDFQIGKRGKFIDLIDFTALWLLVETGALGLLAFAAFFMHSAFKISQTAFQSAYRPPGNDKGFYQALLFFLLAFAIISCLHEILYTRFLWLCLGLALARPFTHRDDNN